MSLCITSLFQINCSGNLRLFWKWLPYCSKTTRMVFDLYLYSIRCYFSIRIDSVVKFTILTPLQLTQAEMKFLEHDPHQSVRTSQRHPLLLFSWFYFILKKHKRRGKKTGRPSLFFCFSVQFKSLYDECQPTSLTWYSTSVWFFLSAQY